MSEAVSCRRGEVSQGIVSLRSSHTLHFGGSAQWWHWGSLLMEQGRTGEMNQENLKVEPHGKVLCAQGVRDKVPRNELGEQWWTHLHHQPCRLALCFLTVSGTLLGSTSVFPATGFIFL